jgi:hypothetical protein
MREVRHHVPVGAPEAVSRVDEKEDSPASEAGLTPELELDSWINLKTD